MNLKFVWYLNVSGTVYSTVVRVVSGLANWVRGGMLGTGEREEQKDGLRELGKGGIVYWRQIVLGDWVKGE